MIFSTLPKAQGQVENERQRNSDPGNSSNNAFAYTFDTSGLKSHQYNKEWMEKYAKFDTSIYVYKAGQNTVSKILELNSTLNISSIDICGDGVANKRSTKGIFKKDSEIK